MTTESERELLELAAKAYGLEGWEWHEDMQAMRSPPKATSYGEAHAYWNSRTDDGDALRLAVKLGISINAPDPEKLTHPHSPVVDARQEGRTTATIEGSGYRFKAPHLRRWSCSVRWVSMAEYERVQNCKDQDLLRLWRDASPEKFENAYTATRLAITLAAAEIGRAMP